MTTDYGQDHAVENAGAVFSALRRVDVLFLHVDTTRRPGWLDNLLASVALAAGAEKIVVATADATVTGLDASISGTAIADSVVISFTAVGSFDNIPQGSGSVTVRPLSQLTSVDLWTSAAVSDAVRWPGRPTATLRFRDGAAITVSAFSMFGEEGAAMAKFVQSLPSRIQGGRS